MNALLCSLDIDSSVRGKGPMPERFRELDDYWNESQGNPRHDAHAADGWITEYSQNRERHDNPDAWANSFEQQYGVNGWASEFEHVRSLHCSTSSYNLTFRSLSLLYTHTSVHYHGIDSIDMKFKSFVFIEETCYAELTAKANIVELLLAMLSYFCLKASQTLNLT